MAKRVMLIGAGGVAAVAAAKMCRNPETFGELLIASRTEARCQAIKADIEARPVWKPLHLQPVFRGSRTYGGEVAETLFALGLCLLSGTGLTDADFRRIFKVL